MSKKIISVIIMLLMVPVFAQEAPVVPIKKYIIGESEFQRQLAAFKLRAENETEIEGFEIGFRQEMEKEEMSLSFVGTDKVILSTGSDVTTFESRTKGVFVEVQNLNNKSWMKLGYFSKNRKLFTATLMKGAVFDLSE